VAHFLDRRLQGLHAAARPAHHPPRARPRHRTGPPDRGVGHCPDPSPSPFAATDRAFGQRPRSAMGCGTPRNSGTRAADR
jgi:hypothetical protein